MYGRSAYKLLPKIWLHWVWSVLGVSMIAWVIQDGIEPSMWTVLKITLWGLGVGLASYGITQLILDYRESENWKEFYRKVKSKYKQAYQNKK